jgi:putative ABC transport system ATP-binding protein
MNTPSQAGKQKQAIVALEHVSKHYSLGETLVKALDDVNLHVGQGEFMAVVGASGSGKSTLLNMIGCLDQPDKGVVKIAGVDLAGLDDNQRSALRNEKIGFIFQTFNLVPVLTVYENVELPLLINPKFSSAQRHESVEQALIEVGLWDRRGQKPDKLSGGQRQRVAIARALAGKPKLVLGDEPTANLDSENSRRIVDLMLELNSRLHVTFVFSTHDEKLMDRVQRKVEMRDGRLC